MIKQVCQFPLVLSLAGGAGLFLLQPSWNWQYLVLQWYTSCCIIDYLNIFSIACVSGCDFDVPDHCCEWEPETENPAMFGFYQRTGPTDTEGTGPDDDFSEPGCK